MNKEVLSYNKLVFDIALTLIMQGYLLPLHLPGGRAKTPPPLSPLLLVKSLEIDKRCPEIFEFWVLEM